MQGVGELIDRWKAENLTLVPPAPKAQILETFESLGSTATADVIALYTSLGGMREMDKALWRLWPLEEIKAENSELSSHGVLFSDYLICCWCYRLKANPDGTSSVLEDRFDGSAPRLVASTLEAFFLSYLADATRLLDGPALD